MIIYTIFGLVFLIISSALILLIGRKAYRLSELKFLNISISLLVTFIAGGLVFYFSHILGLFGGLGLLAAFILPAFAILMVFHSSMKRSVPMLNFTQTFVFLFSILLLFSILFLTVIVPLINSQF